MNLSIDTPKDMWTFSPKHNRVVPKLIQMEDARLQLQHVGNLFITPSGIVSPFSSLGCYEASVAQRLARRHWSISEG